MAERPAPPPEPGWQPVCPAGALLERGRAVRAELAVAGQAPWPVLVLRADGQPRAFRNRCAHQPAELDWNPGEVWDAEGQALICALHGARYDPQDGRCLGGPCGRGRLQALTLRERAGWIELALPT